MLPRLVAQWAARRAPAAASVSHLPPPTHRCIHSTCAPALEFSLWHDDDAGGSAVQQSAFAHAKAVEVNAKVQALRDSALMLVQDWCDPRARQTPQQLQQHTSSSEATEPWHGVTTAAAGDITSAVARMYHAARFYRFVFARHAVGIISDEALSLATELEFISYTASSYAPSLSPVLDNDDGTPPLMHLEVQAIVRLPTGVTIFGSVNQEVAVPGAKTRGILGWLRRRLGSKSAADPDDDDVQPDVNLSGMLLFQQSPEHHQEGFDKVIFDGHELSEAGIEVLARLAGWSSPELDPTELVEVLAASCCTVPAAAADHGGLQRADGAIRAQVHAPLCQAILEAK